MCKIMNSLGQQAILKESCRDKFEERRQKFASTKRSNMLSTFPKRLKTSSGDHH